MNWLGWSTRAMVGAVLGALLGALAFGWSLRGGWDAPYLVGLSAGAGALLASPDRSTMRGLLVATLALWVGATTQSLVGPFRDAGILRFYATLSLPRALAYFVSGLLAFVLGRSSFRGENRAAGL